VRHNNYGKFALPTSPEQLKSGRAQALRFATDRAAALNFSTTPSNSAYRTACAVPLLSSPTPLVATPLRRSTPGKFALPTSPGKLKSGRAQALRFATGRGAALNLSTTPSNSAYRTACAVPLLSSRTPLVATPLRRSAPEAEQPV
jgi:hypothetical protein